MNPQILLLILIIVIVILFITYNNAIKGGTPPSTSFDLTQYNKKYVINSYDKLIETDDNFYIVHNASILPYVIYDKHDTLGVLPGKDSLTSDVTRGYTVTRYEKIKEINCVQYTNGIMVHHTTHRHPRLFCETSEHVIIFNNIVIIHNNYYHFSIRDNTIIMDRIAFSDPDDTLKHTCTYIFRGIEYKLEQPNQGTCDWIDFFAYGEDQVIQILDYTIDISLDQVKDFTSRYENTNFGYIKTGDKFLKYKLFENTFVYTLDDMKSDDYDKYFKPKGYVRQFEGINTRLVKINGDDKIYFVYRLQNPSNPNEPFYMYTYDKKTFDVKSLTMSDL